MHRQRKLKQEQQLLAIRKAKRLAADMALAAAAAAEREARSAEAEATARSREAQQHWSDHVAMQGFSPEYARGLAAQLVEREAESGRAGLVSRRKAELHEERRQEWQQTEAHARQSADSVRRLRRDLQHRQEEARLAELSDRATHDWSRT